jgi:hypothetical protein
VLVAHAIILTPQKVVDQKDCYLKPARANILEKNPSQKRAGGMAQGVGPEFKPQYY